MKNHQIPRQGDSTDLFERLSEYITLFKRSWSDWIKPASKESIERLKEVSEYKKWTDTFPVDYEMFLEKMGDDDGGLLSGPMLSFSRIEDVIDFYEERDGFGDWIELLNKPYLAILCCHMGGAYSIELKKEGNARVVEAGVVSNVQLISENFEKLLFQCAFQKFEEYRYYISFGSAEIDIEQAKNRHDAEDILDVVDIVAKQFNMEKAWFSDVNHYVAFGERISFIAYHYLSEAVVGFVTGEEKELVLEIADVLQKGIGVKKQEQRL